MNQREIDSTSAEQRKALAFDRVIRILQRMYDRKQIGSADAAELELVGQECGLDVLWR